MKTSFWGINMDFLSANLWVLLISNFLFRPVFGEFELISEADLPWRCYYSSIPSDCMTSSILVRFRDVLFPRRQPEDPRNFTVTYFEREALELGGYSDYYYPGVTITLIPETPVSAFARGYQIVLEKDHQTTCLVIKIPENTFVGWMEKSVPKVTDRYFKACRVLPDSDPEDQITQELFPLSGTTHYRISAHALPPILSNGGNHGNNYLATRASGKILDVVTGRFDDYRPGGRYPAPADWIAIIHYMVNGYENGTGQSLEVVFSRPPDTYNFRRFQVALVGLPEDENIDIQVDVTTNYWHAFPDVRPGRYKVSVKPLDDYFSVAEQCLCYNSNGLCTNCLTTETEFFTVE